MRVVPRILREAWQYQSRQTFTTLGTLWLRGYFHQHQVSRRLAINHDVTSRKHYSAADAAATTEERTWQGQVTPTAIALWEDNIRDHELLEEASEISSTLGPSLQSPMLRSATLVGMKNWEWLSFHPERLAFEADVSSAAAEHTRLVDNPDHCGNVALWECLLNFRWRRDGLDGARDILRGLHMRRNLYVVHGAVARQFWRSLLRKSLVEYKTLDQVWNYAEWLLAEHGVRWPDLYATVVGHHIASRHFAEARLWHIRLSGNFGPDAPDFAEFLKRFIRDDDEYLQRLLRELYLTTPHNSLYDDIVPYLYRDGFTGLAFRWRTTLVNKNDYPQSDAARPFLQTMAAYYPETPLSEPEISVSGLGDEGVDGDLQGNGMAHQEERNLQYIINRIHGETFGIKEKTYSDKLVARWFASSWVSLDLAINVVRMFGVTGIGPLALQSLALRERHADRISRRLEQLDRLQIGTGTSNYARAIRHFAAEHDEGYLHALLETDIHPDVFEDENAQYQILQSAAATKNAKLMRLVISVRLAATRDAVTAASNRVLRSYLAKEDRRAVINVLRDMKEQRIQISPTASHAISVHILDHFSEKREPVAHWGFLRPLARLSADMRFPLASAALQRLVSRFGQEGFLDDMDDLALELVKRYESVHNSQHAMFFVHRSDIPDILRDTMQDRLFYPVPRELSMGHPDHPLRKIIDRRTEGAILRWSLHRALCLPHSKRRLRRRGQRPADFGFARGLRLLALLLEHGFHSLDVKHIRDTTIGQLRRLYRPETSTWPGTSQRRRALNKARRNNQLSLEEAKKLCDDAWGSELLPPLEKLKAIMQEEHWHPKGVLTESGQFEKPVNSTKRWNWGRK